MAAADDFIPKLPNPAPGGVEIAPGVRVAEADLRLQYARGGGPGGQNVNKLNTKAELWVPIAAMIGLTERARERLASLAGHRLTQAGGVHIASATPPAPEANRAAAFARLREAIVPRPTRPTLR